MSRIEGPPRIPRPYLILPDGWDAGWKAAKAAARNTFAGVAVLGDSYTQGAPGTTDYMATTWWAQVRAALVAQAALGGDYWPVTYSQDHYTSAAGGTFQGTPPFSAVTATNRLYDKGQFGRVMFWTVNAGAAASVTFTTPYACTEIDLITLDYSNPGWTYQVDGGTVITVTPSVVSTTNPSARRTQLTGLAATTHTVLLTHPQSNGNGALMLAGVCTYPTVAARSAGLGFAWCSGFGQPTTNWVNGGWPADGARTWAGAVAGAGTAFGFPAKPALAIIALGLNDCAGLGFSLDGYENGLRRLCQSLRAGNPNVSLLFILHCDPDGITSDVTSGTLGNPQAWPLYMDRATNVATAFNGAVANLHAKWGERGATLGFQQVTNAHPTDAGHTDIYSLLATIL